MIGMGSKPSPLKTFGAKPLLGADAQKPNYGGGDYQNQCGYCTDYPNAPPPGCSQAKAVRPYRRGLGRLGFGRLSLGGWGLDRRGLSRLGLSRLGLRRMTSGPRVLNGRL